MFSNASRHFLWHGIAIALTLQAICAQADNHEPEKEVIRM